MQEIILGPNFLPGVGPPLIFSAPGLSVPKTATELTCTWTSFSNPNLYNAGIFQAPRLGFHLPEFLISKRWATSSALFEGNHSCPSRKHRDSFGHRCYILVCSALGEQYFKTCSRGNGIREWWATGRIIWKNCLGFWWKIQGHWWIIRDLQTCC